MQREGSLLPEHRAVVLLSTLLVSCPQGPRRGAALALLPQPDEAELQGSL